MEAGHLFDHLLFAVAKPRFTFHIEDPANIGPRALLDFRIAIGKAELECSRQELADGGFAGPHGADEKNALIPIQKRS